MEVLNIHNLPAPLYKALANDQYKKIGDTGVTSLIAPPQIRVLTKRYNEHVRIDALSMLWSMFGSSVHAILERTVIGNPSYEVSIKLELLIEMINDASIILSGMTAMSNGDDNEREVRYLIRFLENKLAEIKDEEGLLDPNEWMVEKRFGIKMNGWIVTGQMDIYQKSKKILYDYKVTSVWKIIKGLPVEWLAQINYYIEIMRAHNMEVLEAYIIVILKDWSKGSMLKAGLDYPRKPVIIMPVKIYASEGVRESMRKRIVLHQQAELLPDEQLPECTEEERWATETIYAIQKAGSDRAIANGKFTNEVDAVKKLAELNNTGVQHELHIRPGHSARCSDHCNVAEFCAQNRRIDFLTHTTK